MPAPVKSGTRLADEMVTLGLRKQEVCGALVCSDRQLYNYMSRQWPIPVTRLSALCDLLDLDPEDLVDERGFLVEME